MSTYLWRPVLTRTQRKTLTFKHFRTGSRTINGSFKTYQNVVWSWPMCTQLKCDSSIFPPIFVECKAPSMTKDFSFNTKYVVIITVITSRASYRVKWSIWYQDVAESKSLFQVGNTESILRNFKSGKKKKTTQQQITYLFRVCNILKRWFPGGFVFMIVTRRAGFRRGGEAKGCIEKFMLQVKFTRIVQLQRRRNQIRAPTPPPATCPWTEPQPHHL